MVPLPKALLERVQLVRVRHFGKMETLDNLVPIMLSV